MAQITTLTPYGVTGRTYSFSPKVLTGTSVSALEEQAVWVVKITLKSKADPNTEAIYYLSHEYWDEGELYSGSPVIYPLLAGEREDLIIEREVGNEIAVLHEPTIDIYGKSDLDTYGSSFYDLRDDYTFQNARVDVYCYFKARNALSTTNSLMQGNLRVRSANWENDELSLLCKQVICEDKEISKRLTLEDFPSMVEAYDYEYGSIVFGQNVVVNAPFVITSTARQGSIFLGFTATGHAMNTFNMLYARNLEGPSDPEYVQCSIDSLSTATHGNFSTSAYGTTSANFGEGWSIVFSPGPNAAKIAFGIEITMVKVGSPTSEDGYMRTWVALAPEFSTANTWYESRILREVVLDHETSSAALSIFGYIYPLLVMTPNENYLIGAEWSNPDSTTDGFKLRYNDPGSNSNDNAQSRDNALRGAWLQQTGLDPLIALYSLQANGGSAFKDSTGTTTLYSRYDFIVQTQSLSPGSYTPNSDGKIHYGLELKADVDGLEDDGSGTYTGSANAVIELPADIIRFLLLDDELGRGLATSAINASSFNSVRSAQSAAGLQMSFAIDRQTYLTDIILTILRQSRTVLYLTRAGEIALHYPTYSSTPGARISEGFWRSELELIGVQDSAENEVINDIELPYGVNKLNPIEDRDLLRRLGGTDAYSAITTLNDTESSDLDSSRVAKAAESVALYGRRTMREPLDLYAETSDAPRKIRNYRFDRMSSTEKTVTIRVPLSEFYTYDLFDILRIAHSDIPTKYGSAKRIRWQNSNSEIVWYDEGIPITWESFGHATGEILHTQMMGDDMVIRVKTMSPF